MVHLLVGEAAMLERRMEGLSPEKRAQVLDRGSNDGTPYVVTSPLPAGLTFEAWLSAEAPAPNPSPVPQAAQRPPGSQRAGVKGVTQMHRTLSGRPGTFTGDTLGTCGACGAACSAVRPRRVHAHVPGNGISRAAAE